MPYLEEKTLIDELYNIVLCQRNLHYVFEIPKARDILLAPEHYECTMQIHDIPSDKIDAIDMFVNELEKYKSHLDGASSVWKTQTQELLFNLINSNIDRMIEHYKGLSDEAKDS